MSQRKKRKRRSSHPSRIFLIALLFAALFIACIFGAYKFMVDSSPYINASPTPGVNKAVSPSPSVQPSSQPTPTSTAHTRTGRSHDDEDLQYGESTHSPNGQYDEEIMFSMYEDDLYGFTCPYPSDFDVTASNGTGVQLSLRSVDGSAYQDIIVNDSPSDTPSMDMRAFLSDHPSAIIEENRSGDDYYYILINQDGQYIYRYEAYSEGSSKGFEFGYSESTADRYAEYPDDIRADFTLY